MRGLLQCAGVLLVWSMPAESTLHCVAPSMRNAACPGPHLLLRPGRRDAVRVVRCCGVEDSNAPAASASAPLGRRMVLTGSLGAL